MCFKCKKIQPVSNECILCETIFGVYFCGICNFFDNDIKKQIYHCTECGICRMGKRDDYIHCVKCRACLLANVEHKCLENKFDQDCPICFDSLFSSTEAVSQMPCGHTIHSDCLLELSRHSYQCPICLKALGDMNSYYQRIENHLLMENRENFPPNLKDKINDIFCNDCEKRSKAPFHYIYHKCVNCASFNTTVL